MLPDAVLWARFADDITTGPSGHFEISLVDIDKHAVAQPRYRHCRGAAMEGLGELLFRETQRLLGALAVGDVMHHPQGADDAAAGVADVLAFLVDGAYLPARFAHDPVLDLVAIAPVAHRAGVRGVDRGPIVGVHRLKEGFVGGTELLRLQPEDPIHLI